MFRLALFFSLCLVLPLHAQSEKRPITFEDVWKVQRLGKPAISPDGQWVAVEVTRFDLEADSSTSNIWLLSTDGKTQKQLTNFKGKNSGPAWSYDGKQIAFISKRSGDVPQIHLISPEGGEARQLTYLPMAPGGLEWGRDGKSIFCVVNTWPRMADDDEYRKREKERKDSKVQAFIIEDALYRIWDTWIADGKRPVVFRVNLATGKHENLFAKTDLFLPPVYADAGSYDVSPDGKTIAFTAESTKEIGTDFNADIYEMPIDPFGEPKNLTHENAGNDTAPAYSPDGGKLAYLRQTMRFFYADRNRLMVFNRASMVSEEWTKSVDRSVSSPCWTPKGDGVVVDVEDKGYHRILGVGGPDKIIDFTKGHSDTAPAIAADVKVCAFLRTTFDFPHQVWVFSPAKEPMRIDRFNDGLVKQWDLGPTKEVYFKGADDEPVQMWIVYPPRFDAKKKWPLIQFVHGGPHNGIPTDFHYRWNMHLLASKGYVVSCVNFHGSSGYGQKFTDSITGDMATKPYYDVMKGTDWMESKPYIDKDRMVAVGASYGGYMMAWINGHTDRFKAMVCHAGVYNWHSMMASDIVRSRERPLGALPWGDLTKIDVQSPQRYAGSFKTPTLVTHGERDFRVPIGQGMEYYNTLRLKGVPTRFVYFPDENHWILKPQNARLWTREFFAWIDRYVGHGPTP
jgi:dipeptidyl aminopeptidase/acylaminoacyl peptidase